MFREALTYPLRADEETLLRGAILALVGGLLARLGLLAVLALVPAVLLAGYVLAVFRASAEGEDAPPTISDARRLAADGLRTLVVLAGYLLVPAVALFVTLGGASTGGRPETFGTTVVVFGAGTVVLFVSLAFAYLLPAALAGVARTGRLGAAVEGGRLRRFGTDGRYFVACVAGLLAGSVAVVLLGALASAGRPGEVLALVGGVYAAVVVARLLGRGVGA